jgi:hypothetical protein
MSTAASTKARSLRSLAVSEVGVDRRARLAVGIVAFARATVFGAQISHPTRSRHSRRGGRGGGRVMAPCGAAAALR